jgi:hypothetical protein
MAPGRYADSKGGADVLSGVDSDSYMDLPVADVNTADVNVNETGGYMDFDMADDMGFDGEGEEGF